MLNAIRNNHDIYEPPKWAFQGNISILLLLLKFFHSKLHILKITVILSNYKYPVKTILMTGWKYSSVAKWWSNIHKSLSPISGTTIQEKSKEWQHILILALGGLRQGDHKNGGQKELHNHILYRTIFFKELWPCMMAHTFNPNTKKTEMNLWALCSSKLARDKQSNFVSNK